MRLPIGIPLVVRNVKIIGPKGLVKVDLIFDTGAVFTALSWSVLKVVGYDPAVVPERQEIITASRSRSAIQPGWMHETGAARAHSKSIAAASRVVKAR